MKNTPSLFIRCRKCIKFFWWFHDWKSLSISTERCRVALAFLLNLRWLFDVRYFTGVSEYDDIFLLLHPSIWLSLELPVYLSNWLTVRLSVISRHSCIHCLIISSGTDQRDFFCVMHLLFNINLLWMNFTRLRFNFVDLNLIEIFSF